ncbi:hypothetical protein GCM10010505_16480 [Kitasatospora aburaviensis]
MRIRASTDGDVVASGAVGMAVRLRGRALLTVGWGGEGGTARGPGREEPGPGQGRAARIQLMARQRRGLSTAPGRQHGRAAVGVAPRPCIRSAPEVVMADTLAVKV